MRLGAPFASSMYGRQRSRTKAEKGTKTKHYAGIPNSALSLQDMASPGRIRAHPGSQASFGMGLFCHVASEPPTTPSFFPRPPT